MAPIKAIKIATLNAAKHFRLDHQLGSLAPGRFADLVLLKELDQIEPAVVFKDGVSVAKNGKLLTELSGSYPDFLNTTVKLSKSFSASDFTVKAKSDKATVKVINFYADHIINYETHEMLEVVNGVVQNDPNQDILNLSVVERYGKNGQIGSAKKEIIMKPYSMDLREKIIKAWKTKSYTLDQLADTFSVN